MATTRQNLRRNLSYLMGDFILDPDGSIPTCSAQGGASGATAIDALLSYYDDDYFNEWFFLLPEGPSSGSTAYGVTRVTDFTSSTGTMELEPNAAAQIDSGRTFELHRYSPAWKHLALNAARLQAVDALALSEVDESLVVDNLLSNFSFETNTTGPVAFTDWSSVGTPTLAVDAATRVHGTQSARIDATGATEGLSQNIVLTVDIADAAGKTLSIRGWLFALTADIARMRVTFDSGSTYTNGPYHQGGGDWEGPSIQRIDVTIPESTTTSQTMIVSIEVADSGTSFVKVDAMTAWVDNVNRYTLPTNFYRGPTQVSQQVSVLEGGYAPLTRNNLPQSGRILRIKGKRLLSEVTAETGSMEISEPEDQLLYAHALEWLADSNMGLASGAVRDDLEADKQRWRVKAAELRMRSSVKPPYQPIYAEQNGVWEIQWEGETGILLLKNRG